MLASFQIGFLELVLDVKQLLYGRHILTLVSHEWANLPVYDLELKGCVGALLVVAFLYVSEDFIQVVYLVECHICVESFGLLGDRN